MQALLWASSCWSQRGLRRKPLEQCRHASAAHGFHQRCGSNPLSSCTLAIGIRLRHFTHECAVQSRSAQALSSCTAHAQPLDVSFMRPFKAAMRKHTALYLAGLQGTDPDAPPHCEPSLPILKPLVVTTSSSSWRRRPCGIELGV